MNDLLSTGLNFHNFAKKIYLSFETGLISLISFLTGFFIVKFFYAEFASTGGWWCNICALSVLHPSVSRSLEESKTRFFANFLSLSIAGCFCYFLGFGYLQLFSVIALNVFFTRIIKFHQGTRISSIQSGIFVVLGITHSALPIYVNLLTRCLETIMGILMGLLAVLISYKFKIREY
jgi:hypothetical protein